MSTDSQHAAKDYLGRKENRVIEHPVLWTVLVFVLFNAIVLGVIFATHASSRAAVAIGRGCVVVSGLTLMTFLRQRRKEKSANQRPDGTSAKAPPSKPSQGAAVPHP